MSKNVESQEENEESSSSHQDSKFLWTILLFFLLPVIMHLWDGEEAITENTVHVVNKPSTVDTPSTTPVSTPTPLPKSPGPNGGGGGGGDFDKGCSDTCTKRKASRKDKFGGDLLDFQDVLRLAEGAHEKVISSLRVDYGEYFDRMFVNGTNEDGGTHYFGMRPADLDGPSRDRMKRKMKIKVLKMMATIRATDSNLNGCDCVGRTGSVDSNLDDSFVTDIPDFYEKYVFANGGHSNAAGHGNKYTEAYTAVFGRDVRPVWEAIGIEMIDRNYAMGAMGGTPIISTCIKEVFGIDVDFLAWNYGMTDGKTHSAAHYLYRGAMIPSRPAFVFVDWVPGGKLGRQFGPIGLSMFRTRVDREPVSNLPDMTPDGIPIPDSESQKIPEMIRNLKCNGRLEGKELCVRNKWSCNEGKLAKGEKCICPHVGKRSSWHMGYRQHALQGHLISLPFLEMLLEALRELVASTPDVDFLLTELQKEEDADFQLFMDSPLLDVLSTAYDTLGNKNDSLYETWFRGPSICRIAYLPAQSRFLGITTESDKTGDVAVYTHETYDTGYAMQSVEDGKIVYLDENEKPPVGTFSILSPITGRSGHKDIKQWEAECPAIVMPDYKDSFYAPISNGKAVLRFPNQKEKEHYGYDPTQFKGVIALIPPAWPAGCKKCPHAYDLVVPDFLEGNVTITVNSKPVKNIQVVSRTAMILEGDNGNLYWEPNPQTEDNTIEFQVAPEATRYHLRLGNFILM